MRISLLFLGVIFFISCNDVSEEVVADIGTSFFPLAVGQERIYEVQEKEYTITGTIDSISYQLREEIVEAFLSGQDSAFVIYRYIRMTPEEDWMFLETWQARRNARQAIVTEGNKPFLKMTFPVFAGKTWNGNRLNTEDEDIFLLDSLNFPFEYEEEQFENTLTVIQSDNQDFIVEQDRRYEVYASGVGLVYKSELILQYCTESDCLGQQIIETGRELEQYLTTYEN